MTDETPPLPPQLPDPATFNGHILYRYGRAFQRVQREDGSWAWMELRPQAPVEVPLCSLQCGDEEDA